MSDRTPPSDADAERAVIGSVLVWPSGVDDITATGIRPHHLFVPAHQTLWEAVLRLRGNGDRIDAIALVQTSGVDADLVMTCQHEGVGTASARRHARILIDHAVRRDLIVTAADAMTSAYQLAEPAEIAGKLEVAAASAVATLPDDSIAAADFMAIDQPYDWVIPHVLERGDRLLITAGEGQGKSVLLIQLAVMAAIGTHPWTHRPMPAMRVLYIDLELGQRRVSRHLHWIAKRSGVTDNLRVISRPEGVNLLGSGAAWLARQLAAHPCDIVVLGPVYKLHGGVAERGDIGGEDMTRRLVAILDRLRIRYGVALVMETHAPHASAGALRDLRPFGSSVWLRWPDFGIGLRLDKDVAHRYKLSHWRGPRDDRWWPTHLDHGTAWPWEPYWANGLPEEEMF